MPDDVVCWCQSGLRLEHCCQPILEGRRPALTAEALMRSRYSAYVTHNARYLMRTWHARTRPLSIDFDPAQRWLGLKIKRVEAGGPQDVAGIVEFVARYKIHGKAHRLAETSRFERMGTEWSYVDGEVS